MHSKIRVRALGDALVPYYLPGGDFVRQRYAGRGPVVLPPALQFDRDGRAPLPHQPIPVPPALAEGEEVFDLPEFRVAIAHGDLELVEAAPEPAPGAPLEVSAEALVEALEPVPAGELAHPAPADDAPAGAKENG